MHKFNDFNEKGLFRVFFGNGPVLAFTIFHFKEVRK